MQNLSDIFYDDLWLLIFRIEFRLGKVNIPRLIASRERSEAMCIWGTRCNTLEPVW